MACTDNQEAIAPISFLSFFLDLVLYVCTYHPRTVALHRVAKAMGIRNVISSKGMPAMMCFGINISAVKTVAPNMATTMQAIRITSLKRLGSWTEALFIVVSFWVWLLLRVENRHRLRK